jgi:hypothetical protein
LSRGLDGECLLVAVKLEGPVGCHFEGVNLEGKLGWIDVLVELPIMLRVDDDLTQC